MTEPASAPAPEGTTFLATAPAPYPGGPYPPATGDPNMAAYPPGGGYPPGAYPPGAYPPGPGGAAYPPGAYPPGGPAAYPPGGAYPPGAYPPVDPAAAAAYPPGGYPAAAAYPAPVPAVVVVDPPPAIVVEMVETHKDDHHDHKDDHDEPKGGCQMWGKPKHDGHYWTWLFGPVWTHDCPSAVYHHCLPHHCDDKHCFRIGCLPFSVPLFICAIFYGILGDMLAIPFWLITCAYCGCVRKNATKCFYRRENLHIELHPICLILIILELTDLPRHCRPIMATATTPTPANNTSSVSSASTPTATPSAPLGSPNTPAPPGPPSTAAAAAAAAAASASAAAAPRRPRARNRHTCWFANCTTGERNLHLPRPFLVHCCREHHARVESLLPECVEAGDILVDSCTPLCGGPMPPPPPASSLLPPACCGGGGGGGGLGEEEQPTGEGVGGGGREDEDGGSYGGEDQGGPVMARSMPQALRTRRFISTNPNEPMPVKDSVCGLCLGLSTTLSVGGGSGSGSATGGGSGAAADLVPCTSPSCPFVFCRHCVDNLASLPNVAEPMPEVAYTFDQLRAATKTPSGWRCWVCLACERFSRPREREAVVDLAAQKLGALMQPLPSTPQTTKKQTRQKVTPPTTTTVTGPSPGSPPSERKRRPSAVTSTVTSTPPPPIAPPKTKIPRGNSHINQQQLPTPLPSPPGTASLSVYPPKIATAQLPNNSPSPSHARHSPVHSLPPSYSVSVNTMQPSPHNNTLPPFAPNQESQF
ncbi:hypothetical protein Pelo_10303 [Pelomyxa schiedti]|nr:hypothetical protein Pelo_10303 [Pelomyxa schiedti]